MAAGAAKGVSLKCLLCCKDYNVPRILPCHHTFCAECLKRYITTFSDVEFLCPVGCVLPKVLDTTMQVDELVKTLPLNSLYISLAKSERLAARDCDHCPADTGARPGTMWCRNCKGALCEACTVDHRKRRISMHHDIIEIATVENDDVSNTMEDETCSHHKGRKLVSFCPLHFELCCSECGTSRHIKCELMSIADARQRELGTVHFAEMAKKISELCKLQEKSINELDIQYGQHLATMADCITKAKATLDRLHKQFNAQVQEEKKTRKHQKEILEQTKMFQTELENNFRISSTIENNVSQKKMLVISTQLNDQTRRHFQTIQHLLNGCIDVKVEMAVADVVQGLATLDSVGDITETFYNSVTFKDALDDIEQEFTPPNSSEDHQFSSLGQEDKNDSSYYCMDPPSLENYQNETTVKLPYRNDTAGSQQRPITGQMGSSVLPRPCVPSRPEMVLASTLQRLVSVKSSDLGRRTWLTGATYLPDGRLILADFGNGQIILFDERYNVIRKEKLDEGPQEVAYCEYQNIVYVRTGIHIVKFSLDRYGLRKLGTIELPAGSNHHCGIELLEDTLVVGSLGSVVLMSKDGRVLRVIKREGKPYAVTVCRNLKLFCYAHNKDIVYCQMDGSEVCRLNRKQYDCKKVRGMCLDMYGHLHVCCVTQPKGYIYQLPQNGQKGRKLSYQGDIKRPRFVTYHPRKHEFIVLSFQESVAFEAVMFDET
ncbi:uncharacterized protein [Argopecten irradians]|uniref:uncharacterized protein n=1 Tax=Argopecten irradians TaxID=31199 RepID=UPI003718D0FE